MEYLDSLKNSFDKPTQANLINRLIIRLGREKSCLFPKGKYVSEEDLDKRIPIHRDSFAFSEWTQLRDEIEAIAIRYAYEPKLLESMLVRYIQPFDFAANALFPDEGHSEYDIITAATLRHLSDYYSFNQDGQSDLRDYLQKEQPETITDDIFNGYHQDLTQLHRLVSAMCFLALIIQGVLFEVSSSITLQTIQKDCHLTLTDSLIAWKMAPLMGWTTDYCRTLMGNRIVIDLEREPIVAETSETLTPDDDDDSAFSEKKRTVVRKKTITADKLISLAQVLSEDNYTRLQEDNTWLFNGPATLYAYMGYRILKVCELTQIPWQPLLRIIKVKGDSNYLKAEASSYKKTQKFPQGYIVINDAISQVFKY